MLPLSLLKAAQNHPMLVELKNGETYNGHLINCDSWMNIYLRDVICTSRDGDKFWKISECFIRGITIKYIRIPDEVLDTIKEDMVTKSRQRNDNRPTKSNRGKPQGAQRGNAQAGGRGGGRMAK